MTSIQAWGCILHDSFMCADVYGEYTSEIYKKKHIQQMLRGEAQ